MTSTTSSSRSPRRSRRVTFTCGPPTMTWRFVAIQPSARTTKPVPSDWSVRMVTTGADRAGRCRPARGCAARAAPGWRRVAAALRGSWPASGQGSRTPRGRGETEGARACSPNCDTPRGLPGVPRFTVGETDELFAPVAPDPNGLRRAAPLPDFTCPRRRTCRRSKSRCASRLRGQWLVLLFYPLDFTTVCPTELRAFSDRYDEFVAEADAESSESRLTRSSCIARGSRRRRTAAASGSSAFPLASDITHEASKAYGVLHRREGPLAPRHLPRRSEGMLRFALVNDLDVGRSVDETLRTIQAFKTGGILPRRLEAGAGRR